MSYHEALAIIGGVDTQPERTIDLGKHKLVVGNKVSEGFTKTKLEVKFKITKESNANTPDQVIDKYNIKSPVISAMKAFAKANDINTDGLSYDDMKDMLTSKNIKGIKMPYIKYPEFPEIRKSKIEQQDIYEEKLVPYMLEVENYYINVAEAILEAADKIKKDNKKHKKGGFDSHYVPILEGGDDMFEPVDTSDNISEPMIGMGESDDTFESVNGEKDMREPDNMFEALYEEDMNRPAEYYQYSDIDESNDMFEPLEKHTGLINNFDETAEVAETDHENSDEY